MSQPAPTSNRLTETVTKQDPNTATIRIESNGTPEMTRIRLSDGRSLGLIQRASWSMEVGDYARLTVETLAAPADLSVLLKDATIIVRPASGYGPFQYLWDWVCAWTYNLFTSPTRKRFIP